MSYCFTRKVDTSFADTVQKVTDELAKRGFGVLTQIDVQATLKKKLDVDFVPYLILGACKPPYAYAALKMEANIGTMLPCNVIVKATPQGDVEVSAIDPVASMTAVNNEELLKIASTVRDELAETIEAL